MSGAGVFVTGTDTGVGKTVVAAALLAAAGARGLTAAGMKPVATGCEPDGGTLVSDDARLLMEHASVEAPYGLVNPYAFEPAIAPHIAAAEAGAQIDPATILVACETLRVRAAYTVVEGIGGWHVPLGEHLRMSDVAAALGLPVVLVVGMRLGCLNHALLSADAIAASGLKLAGWVANHADPAFERAADNVAALTERIDAPLLAELPFLQPLQIAALATRFGAKGALPGES